jgi:hypothetical protein
MKPPVRGKYLVAEHAVELRRIIPALPIVLADGGPIRYHGGIATARTPTGGRAQLLVRDLRSQGGERLSRV